MTVVSGNISGRISAVISEGILGISIKDIPVGIFENILMGNSAAISKDFFKNLSRFFLKKDFELFQKR